MIKYIKIPKEVIYDTDIGHKRVCLFSYLYVKQSYDNTVAFSISELCTWFNQLPNRHKGKINEKLLLLLNEFAEKEYFNQYPDFLSISNVNYYYSIDLNTNKINADKYFGIIYWNEFQDIINYKEQLTDIQDNGISVEVILLLLSYIRLNMNKTPSKPLCCYRLYRKISEDTGIPERNISKILKILDKLHILKTVEPMRIKNIDINSKGTYYTMPKIFADYYHYKKDGSLVNGYNPDIEIQKQISIFQETKTVKTSK